MRVLAWLRSLFMGEKEWCFESQDAAASVLARIKAEIRELGPMRRIGVLTRGWRNLPQQDGIFGHASGKILQLSVDRDGPASIGDILILWFTLGPLIPATFYFDGRIEPRPNGSAIRGRYRQHGPARYVIMVFVLLGTLGLTALYGIVLWLWHPIPVAIIVLLAVPTFLFSMYCVIMRMGAAADLSNREDLYEFLLEKARPNQHGMGT